MKTYRRVQINDNDVVVYWIRFVLLYRPGPLAQDHRR